MKLKRIEFQNFKNDNAKKLKVYKWKRRRLKDICNVGGTIVRDVDKIAIKYDVEKDIYILEFKRKNTLLCELWLRQGQTLVVDKRYGEYLIVN